MIVAAVEAEPGLSWTRVVKQAPGVRAERRKAVRDELLKAERIVNVVKNEAGEEVALAHCPERRPAHLYPGDDPTIRHLRPDPDAGGTQAASARGGGETAALRPASRPYRDAGRRDAADTPQIALGADSYSDNTDAADDDAQEVEPQA
jgi:hypothetical protein